MEIREVAQNLIQPRSIFYMATVEDGHPRVRPMTCVHVEGFKIWTCSHKSTPKMLQLAKNNEVECCFLDNSGRQLRVRGNVKIFEDEKTWSQLPISPESMPMVEDPNFALLLIEPTEVRLVNDWSTDYKSIPV